LWLALSCSVLLCSVLVVFHTVVPVGTHGYWMGTGYM